MKTHEVKTQEAHHPIPEEITNSQAIAEWKKGNLVFARWIQDFHKPE